jgi:hypothetical protein
MLNGKSRPLLLKTGKPRCIKIRDGSKLSLNIFTALKDGDFWSGHSQDRTFSRGLRKTVQETAAANEAGNMVASATGSPGFSRGVR